MKKLISVILTFALIFSFSAIYPVFASGLTVTADSIEVESGAETAVVNINVSGNTGIAVLGFDVGYDSSVMSLGEVKIGTDVFEPGDVIEGNLDKNPYTISALYALDNRTGNGLLATLEFNLKSDCPDGEYKIELLNAESYTIMEDVVDVNLIDGKVKVGQGGTSDSGTTQGGNDGSSSVGGGSSSGSGSVSGGGGASFGGGSAVVRPSDKNNTSTDKATIDNTKNTIVLTIDKKDAVVFGEIKTNDVAPLIRNDRTMLPARFVAENLGATVSWDEVQRKVTIVKGDTKLEIIIGDYIAFVNGKQITIDSPAFIENDRTYTPLRFIAESLGAKVEWNETLRTVTITR